MYLDGNDKNKTVLRGLNSWVLNFMYFSRIPSCGKNCCDYPRNSIAERNFVKYSNFRSS